jgi:predicted CXXCH cytochrome family protein
MRFEEQSQQRRLNCLGEAFWARVCRMFKEWLRIAILFSPLVTVTAQDIDANITAENRRRTTIADQISDASERAAFLALFLQTPPEQRLEQAQSFLRRFPQSSFLFQAFEVAARASFDLRDYESGLNYAEKSLALLPENPLLLVSTADVEARQHRSQAAISHAQDAIEGLDRFSAPSTVAPESWPDLKPKLKAIAHFAKGRALLGEALELAKGERRTALLRNCVASLEEAQRLNSLDPEITYLLGLAQLSADQLLPAAGSFLSTYKSKDTLAPKAFENLQTIYRMLKLDGRESFESFVERAEDQEKAPSNSPVRATSAENRIVQPLADYAGSQSCRGCHSRIYDNWSQTGMAKMLRPYSAQDVMGDFETNNEFYFGDDARYVNGKVEVMQDQDRMPFARMAIREGRHYFDILQSDGKWHTYPVDYTIGSKFQQAYATKLPKGEIHVFPIQYSKLTKQWINYWKIIDAPAGERADLRAWEKLDGAASYQAICAVCHTSQLRNVAGRGFEAQNVAFKEPGVDCEMCHGPSAQHVAEMTANQHFPKRPLDPPVNFHDLTNLDSVRICAQCHMQSALRTPGSAGELNFSRSGEFFIRNPSIPFGEFSRIGFYKDGRFRQTTFIVEALERSQCFRKGQVSCGTCHDPHGPGASSNPTSLKFRDQPDLMCTGCHSQFEKSARLAAHTHHRAESEASRCVSCHMPRIMDAVLFRARTHQIDDIPNAEMAERFGQQDSPNACLLCHSDKSSRWLKQELAAWKPHPR